jgi:molecular chaperone GrpE
MPDKQNDNSIEIEIKDEHDLEQEKDNNEGTAQDVNTDENVVELKDPEEQTGETDDDVEETPDYYDQYMRVQAEFQNYKRRSEQRMQEWRMYAAKDIVSQLLPVIDDFDILFAHHQDGTEELCVDGVKMIYNKMLAALVDIGLQPMDAQGQEFDPNLHEALMAEETDEVDEGHVLKVWQQGFLFKDQLLRPAKVITAKAKQNG